jgi:hypothetical protein
VYGHNIHATKDLIIPLFGDAQIEEAKIREATDSMEGIAVPDGCQVLKTPEHTEQGKDPLEPRIKSAPEQAANSKGVPMNGDLEATIKAIVEKLVNEKCQDY